MVALVVAATIILLVGRSSRFATQLAQATTVLLALILYAHAIPALRPVGTALLASASVATIVIGLAAQSTLGNILAGIVVLLFKPFEVGDLIQVGVLNHPETGTVEEVNLGYTVVTTLDNRRVVVPNGQIVNQTTVNLSLVSARHLAQIDISVAYDTDIDRAVDVVAQIITAQPQCESLNNVAVTALGPYAVTLTAFAWCTDDLAARTLQFAVYRQALAALPPAGIEIPLPASTVEVRSDDPDRPGPGSPR